MYRLFCLALLAFLGGGLMVSKGRADCDNYCRMRGEFWGCKAGGGWGCFITMYPTCRYCVGPNWCDDGLGGGTGWCFNTSGQNAWYLADSCDLLCDCDPPTQNVEAKATSSIVDPKAIPKTYCGYF